jgi:hypothetical protein
MELVCDNSELNGIWGAEAPDILVIGGYAIPRDMTVGLLDRVKAFKAKHGLDEHCPVKWNMRDLDRPLAAHGLKDQKQILIEKSDVIRTDMLDALTTAGAVIFISAINAYSNNKQVLGKTKEDLVGYSFGNLLMRVGLFCKEKAGGRRVDSLLDWPEANNRTPFTTEYHTGWRYGRSGPEQGGIKYQCGSLAQIAFAPTVAFAAMEFEPRLQLADLVVGAGLEFINYLLGKKEKDSFGVQRFKAFLPHLYKSNGQTLGRGITVSPTNGDLSTAVLKGLNSLGA